MTSTPLRTRRKTGDDRRGPRKLTRWDAERIRRWALTEGADLSLNVQVEVLRSWPTYAMMGVATLKDLLRNDSWHDPSYVPRSGESAQPVQMTIPTLGFLCLLLFLWRSACGSSGGSFDGTTPPGCSS